jgi:hypothetical protein
MQATNPTLAELAAGRQAGESRVSPDQVVLGEAAHIT